MKTIGRLLIISVISIFLFSCGGNKPEVKKEEKAATNLDELTKKFDKREFKNCDEFLAAGDEIIDVYIATVNKAYDGDAKSKEDLEEFEVFMNNFDKKAEKFSLECPDKFDQWATKTDERVAAVTEKLITIFYEEYEGLEWDEELDKELEKQIEELNEDLKKVQEEDEAAAVN
jgi:hypothetical protein